MRSLVVSCVLVLSACKVPISDIRAGFTISEAAWFLEEETLFLFYRIDASQALDEHSQVEVTYVTDTTELPWTPLESLTPVHRHVPASCGSHALCGSMSLHVPDQPRQVRLRLRYHEDGAMTLDAPLTYNIIGAGPDYSHRSLLVYGVFNEDNTFVQWRARHQFPTLRNTEVQELGLRRYFRIEGQRHGALDASDLPPELLALDPYAYAFAPACPASLQPLAAPTLVETWGRAVFNDVGLPLAASTSPAVCAEATVLDATGEHTAPALARKNPDVRPAFPVLRSPINLTAEIGYLLAPCNRSISTRHRNMQRERLQLEDDPVICIDAWQSPGFVDSLVATLRARIDEVRAGGDDMVLKLALHHDDPTGAFTGSIEAALAQILPLENARSSPRLSGAFVFDSYGYEVQDAALRRLVLWCPADLPFDDLSDIPSAAERTCPLLPDDPDLQLGPFRFGTLPILPTRAQYLNFVSRYSEAQAGSVQILSFRAPERTPTSENFDVDEYGVVTFFNNEVFSAAPEDSFSYCMPEGIRALIAAFKTPDVQIPLPLALLPEAHALAPQSTYELGIFWDFPFLLRMRYEIVISGAATAVGFTVPFGVGTDQQSYYGTELWKAEEFHLEETLLQCTRFCGHPTFDSARVYNVTAQFDPDFRNNCYRPDYPKTSDGGFPRDP